MRLCAAQRRQPKGGQLILERANVVLAQGEVVNKVDRALTKGRMGLKQVASKIGLVFEQGEAKLGERRDQPLDGASERIFRFYFIVHVQLNPDSPTGRR